MTDYISVFPKATEKAYGLSKSNVYVFEAPVTASKQQITAAIESQFGVKIVNIKTLIQTGKAVRANRGKRSQPGIAHRKDSKKAYVTLAAGDSIKVFDEQTPAAETKVEVKKADKAEKKEKK